jgi:hypothetical protein
VFGVGHGPVDSVVVSNTCQPREGFTSVVSSAERILVGSRGWTVRMRLVMIKVAALRWHGTGREAAGSGPDHDRLGEPSRGVAAQFGGVQQPTSVVGEQSGKQHLITTISITTIGITTVGITTVGLERFGDVLPQRLTGDESGPVSQSSGGVSFSV